MGGQIDKDMIVGHQVRISREPGEKHFVTGAETRRGRVGTHLYLTLVDRSGGVSLAKVSPEGCRISVVPREGCCHLCEFLLQGESK